MHGKGTFFDPRLNDPVQFPVAARAGFGNVRNDPDLITPNWPPCISISSPSPHPPRRKGSFDAAAAARGS